MTSKAELAELLLPAILDSGKSEADARAMLDRCTVSELGLMKDKQIRAGIYRPAQKPATPSMTQQEVEREKARLTREHEAELQRIRDEAEDKQIRSQAEAAVDDFLFRKSMEPHYRAQAEALLARDRAAFEDAARVLRSFAVVEANLNVLRGSLGPGNLSVSAIQQAIQSGAVSLAPATEEQLTEYERGDIQTHNERLLQANPAELRAAVRTESEQRRIQSQQETAAEADRAHAARDAARGYPPLPAERFGKPLDSAYIKRADRAELRFLIQRYGETQVTNRLRQIDSAQPNGE